MKNETSNRQDHKEDDDEVVQQNLIRTFKIITKFQTSTEIEIRVNQGSKEFGNQLIPFHQACDIIQTTSTIRICTLDCRFLSFWSFQKPVSWANGFFIGRCS